MTNEERYNKWLFEKYGFGRGALFENIPILFRINPLFSPSIYHMFEGEQFVKGLEQGIKDGIKMDVKIKTTPAADDQRSCENNG